MRLTLLNVLSLTALFISSTNAFQQNSGSHSSTIRRRRNWSHYTNGTEPQGDDPAELFKRDGTKYVFMHHFLKLFKIDTFPYTYADWLDDMIKIAAKGVDAIALNIGGSDWQRNQVATAYSAARDSNTGIKLFYSFDLTEMDCNVADLVARVNLYNNHPNQFKVNGKAFISSFSGGCLGNDGWQSLKSQTNGYIMPFIWGLENNFQSWPSLDSWYCWGCAWPQGNYPKNMDDDNFYISQLGTKYGTTVGPWMYTHYTWKNFYLRGDDWLVVSRWEQLMQLRSTLTFVELATWNDYGESSYYGPIKGAQPDGTTWANGYPHTAWYDLTGYYVQAFKTGSYPAITQDVIYFWARPHPAGATASGDNLGKPTGWDWTEDSMWAAVFATSPATVVLRCGSSSSTFNVSPGVNKLKIPLAAGKITVQMIRNGQTIINYTPSDYTYVLNPVRSADTCGGVWRINIYKSGVSSTSTSTSSTASATPTGWNTLGCVAEGTSGSRRALTGASYTQSNMTPQVCQGLCSGYQYAGVEAGNECFCGNSLLNNGASGLVIDNSNCQWTCSGDSNQKCGGSWTLNVYTKSAVTPPFSSAWALAGCFVDADSRMLRGYSVTLPNTLTVETCTNICNGAGYIMAAVEYGQECYCGSQIYKDGGAGVLVDAGQCNVACSGNAGQKCGGGWRANLYTKPGTTWT
ncbi:Glucan endo-1,3-alpha-glucosidase agn1 [Psilocybe cubensis]|uniref:Glucan endo-1,3-alpha-glucosidase agn1 n=2 Tax=Psilocybe cubensis TaxID=181762 RepID=A0ACB8GM76_PSICU|nr:Glucan endo-1,3-alpha-glucosidase agn1 [Psilocybe cubensis]KAH9476860.1 Glucan endo-1,3-alpha-glucosidase agn1 [Psilocybe cubensis]